MNGSRQWVPQWAAVPNPSNIAGVCGNEVCNLDRSKTKELLKLTGMASAMIIHLLLEIAMASMKT